jgi:septal ring factor EnvC (AmiA/AmiB activator)
MMWRKILLCLFCLLVLSSLRLYAQSSVRDQVQVEILILRVQLQNCKMKIENLQISITALNNELQTYQQTTGDLQTQSNSLKAQLLEQQATYKTLSAQLEDLKSLLKKYQTDQTWLIIGICAAGAVAVSFSIAYFLK